MLLCYVTLEVQPPRLIGGLVLQLNRTSYVVRSTIRLLSDSYARCIFCLVSCSWPILFIIYRFRFL